MKARIVAVPGLAVAAILLASCSRAAPHVTTPGACAMSCAPLASMAAVNVGTVPDLVGLTAEQADETAISAGYMTLLVHREQSTVISSGRTISSSPRAGSPAPLTQTITIVVSTGP